MRLGSPLKNHTWLTGVASVICPRRSRRTLACVTSTLVAVRSAVLHALVLAAEALPVGDRAEDLRAEQPVAFRLERAVVDRLRLRHLAERPRHDLFWRGKRDPNRVEIGAQARF